MLNNLSSSGALLAFASQSKAKVVNSKLSGSSANVGTVATEDGALVMQSKWCVFEGGAPYLALALKTGLQVWSADAKRMFLWAPLPTLVAKAPAEIAAHDAYTTGLCSFTAGGVDCLCVGTSIGAVVVFHHDRSQGKFTLAQTLRTKPPAEHEPPVVELSTGPRSAGGVLVARADSAGAVQLWSTSDGNTFLAGRRIVVDELACTSVVVSRGLVVSSYSNGELYVHHAESGAKLAKVAAHARWINALAVHPSKPLVAAASEDTFVSVWSIAEDGDSAEVKNVCFWQVQDAILCGVAFHGENGAPSVAASAYDSNALHLFSLP